MKPNNNHGVRGRIYYLTSSLFLVTLLMVGCSKQQGDTEYITDSAAISSNNEMSESINSDNELAPPLMTDRLLLNNLSGISEQTLGSQVANPQVVDKNLIITAKAIFEVEDVVKSTAAIESLTQQCGGYVELSNISNSAYYDRTYKQGDKDISITTYDRRAVIRVRIPSQKVNDFMKKVQQQVKFLELQEFEAKDVTLDIYKEQLSAQLNSDMASELDKERLKTKNEKEQRDNRNSITATYDARRKAEFAKLQQMDITDKLKYSTIELNLSQPNLYYERVSQNLDAIIEKYEPSFLTQLGEAFESGWDMLKRVIIGIVGLWWLWSLILLLLLVVKLLKTMFYFNFKTKSRVKHTARQDDHIE